MKLDSPYKLGFIYKFVLLPHFISNVPLETIGIVTLVTNHELVIESADSDGNMIMVIIGRNAVKTAVETTGNHYLSSFLS